MPLRRSSSLARRPTEMGRRPLVAATAWNTTASVMTRTRKPAACTRQQKSMSSPNRVMPGSKPPVCSQTSRRTSMPALLTASESRSPSCWPWSTSRGSMPVIRRPTVSIVSPASTITSRSVQSISFGPSTAAVGVSAAPRSSCSSASAAGSQSSCSSHSHSTWSSRPRAGHAAAPTAHRRVRGLVLKRPPHRSRVAGSCGPSRRPRPGRAGQPAREPLRSRLPVSTATTRCTGLVCSFSASSRCGSHAAPSWATITAVTTCWEYESVGDKGFACVRVR